MTLDTITAAPAWFITGTDTDVGKTFVACALLHALRQRGLQALGMKPVAAGCDAAGRNEDVEQLIAASASQAPRELVNPYAFGAAIAPHIAAADANIVIDLRSIVDACQRLRASSQALVVEGAGGFCVPLGPDCDSADLARALGLPVILVVGMRLGCLNHALLTQQAIAASGLPLAGWIANCIDPAMPRQEENLRALQQRIHAPLLAVIPYGTTPEAAARKLQLPDLIFA